MSEIARAHVTPCVSLCECLPPRSDATDIDALTAATCTEAGFPVCGRLYFGSYFCENYFCGLVGHACTALREFCRSFDMRVTLVIPLAGQSSLYQVQHCTRTMLDELGDTCDEVVANDVATFLQLSRQTGKRLGLGRLFCKERRDARYVEVAESTSFPSLSPEALECIDALAATRPDDRPLVELDPTSRIVDAQAIVTAAPTAEVCLHLPLCYATTGRVCSISSLDAAQAGKFRPGAPCAFECLDVTQTYYTVEGVRFVKHGRTQFFQNPECQIAGIPDWRIIYAGANEVLR